MKEVERKRKLQDDKKGVFEDQMKRISQIGRAHV